MQPARRDQRGVVFPSAVTVLSIVAVAMAAVAWVATRHPAPTERQVTPAAQQSPSPAHHSTFAPPKTHHRPHRPAVPAVDRSKVQVSVFNNSQVTGLAAQVAARVSRAGWQVSGSDNWYGTIPSSTVYYPPQLARAGHLLALDLGVHRTMRAVSPMRLDRLTVILTGPLATPAH
jgi:hypothetical protein